MDTQHFFGGGGQTEIHPVVLAFVIIASILIFSLPKRYVAIPLLATAILVPLDQQVVLGGIHITMSRVLILLGWARALSSGSPGQNWIEGGWTKIDSVFAWYCVSNAVTYVILWGGDSGALINRLGFLFNAGGMYFLVRFYVRDREDLDRLTLALVWVFGLVGLGMVAEQVKGENIFSILGGVPLVSVIRDGKIRAQGVFVHPLTAGAIGATFLPLALGLRWIDGRYKWRSWIGASAAVAIGLTSRSSTALLTLAAGLIGMLLWRFRGHLRTLRRSIVVILATLHLVMKAPVWALISRIDLTGSSSGYHRYILVDQFIRRFSEWWLIGTRTTADWGWDMWDTINSYVAAGTSGGLINFVLFVSLFVVAFKQLGRRRNLVSDDDPILARYLWVLGCVLFAHAVAFFGIAYFDQSQFVWYAGLAVMASALTFQPSKENDSTTTEDISEDLDPWQFDDAQSELIATKHGPRDGKLSSPAW